MSISFIPNFKFKLHRRLNKNFNLEFTKRFFLFSYGNQFVKQVDSTIFVSKVIFIPIKEKYNS